MTNQGGVETVRTETTPAARVDERHAPVANRPGGAAGPNYGTLGPAEAPQGPEAVQWPSPTEAGERTRLDAYWASYGDDAIRAVLRDKQAMEAVLETVIGPDDRVQVHATDQYPWRAIASLEITDQYGGGWIGTAWLIGPRLLLTAGHCVYMHDQGGWARSIEVIPGRNGDHKPFGSCVATDYRSVTGWTTDGDSRFDYGVILLPADCRYGDQVGWFGTQVRSDGELASAGANLSGYPGDKPPGTQWFHHNTISGVAERVLTYQIDTYGGQSGAPVWVDVPGQGAFGIAVHTNGSLAGNSGVRITGDLVANLNTWASEVP
jgi:glutamyl endopeptidase